MTYLELKEQLNEFITFSLSDIRKVEPNFNSHQLLRWQNKNYIKRLRRNCYIFSDLERTEEVLFLIANRIYEPSYVSLEMALSFYNLIPEGVYSVTSITTKKTNNFNTPLATFNFRHMKPAVFFGYKLVRVGNQNYKVAEIEKAVLDYLYLNPVMSDADNFTEWRFDFETFKSNADMEKFYRYLKNFNSPSLDQRVKRFIKFMEKN